MLTGKDRPITHGNLEVGGEEFQMCLAAHARILGTPEVEVAAESGRRDELRPPVGLSRAPTLH